jgi:SPX domain protein involved in polyphosphate accumulation
MPYPKLEYKYLLPLDRLDAVRRELLPLTDLDPWADKTGRGSYTVRSIYFDDAGYSAYREKIGGERQRRKFRVRAYNDRKPGDIAFLEIKRKEAGLLTKYRAALAAENVEALLAEQDIDTYILPYKGDGINKTNAERFFYHYQKDQLRPVILIVYEREAFVGRFSTDLRVTIDRNLRSVFMPGIDGLYDGKRSIAAMQRHCILEVKFTTGVPLALRQIIQRHELRRMALSKYTICLDSHRDFSMSQQRERIVNLTASRRHAAAVKVFPAH